MGNQSSKPTGPQAPTSPAAHHSSSSSTANSRKEPKSQPAQRAQNASGPTHGRPLQRDSQAQAISSSPSRRPRPADNVGNEQPVQQAAEGRRKERDKEKEMVKHGTSTPMTVPRGSDPRRQRGPDSQFEPSGPPRDPNYIPHSNLNFPPRLPLPIEEEVHLPGSPPIAPQDLPSSLTDDEIDGPLHRRSSAISSTTIEEDAAGDELQPYTYEHPSRATVPTLLQWKQGGEKVYVTGTFTNWSRKFRMNRDPNTGCLTTTLQLPPGTHHVKFIIDGDMQLSNELPTAVDYTNILVNYIEVSADDIPKGPLEKETAPEGVHPPQVVDRKIEAKDHAPDSVGKTMIVEGEPQAEPVFWGKEMPKYLHDVDLPENTQRYQRAAKGVNEFSTPPGLPLFLGKSILNGTTPMKDDSSVLNMPNHTVLNHLATSSIKNDVLATSMTTRYKRKYVTTIVYKPTELID